MKLLRDNRVKIFFTVTLVYLFYISPGDLPALTTRYIVLTKAIVDDGEFYIDKYDDSMRDVAPLSYHTYIGAAPGPSFVAIPFYIAIKPVISLVSKTRFSGLTDNLINICFIFFLSVLPGSLTAVFLYNILGSFKLLEREKILTVFACSFGTILFYYSTRLSAHVLGAFLVIAAFYILQKFKNVEKKWMFLIAGICLGAAVLMEYSLLIPALLMPLYSVANFRKRKIPDYIFLLWGEFIVALVYLHYHLSCFPNPIVPATLYNRTISHVPLTFPTARMILTLLFGTYRGIFLYMPILMVPIIGIFTFVRKPEKQYTTEVTLISLISMILFMSYVMFCTQYWDTGATPLGGAFGPRHLLSFIPLLLILTVYAYKTVSYNIIKWITFVSVFINWCGVQYGDADNPFINVGLFFFRGLNSGLATWTHDIVNTHIRKFNVITHFSPLISLIALLIFIYLIWKNEIDKLARSYFCKTR